MCERDLALVNALFGPRFRHSVGTLVPHGKGGILSLYEDRAPSLDPDGTPHCRVVTRVLSLAVRLYLLMFCHSPVVPSLRRFEEA